MAKFSDANLFNRLFHQGKSRDDQLLRTARACALVYSFDSGSGGNATEITLLANWAGTDTSTLHYQVAELHRRGLVQRRDVWCAVLPQALAVHLAREALEGLAPHQLEQALQQAPARLMRSFTRQLGLLHDSPEAEALVKRWIVPDSQPCHPLLFNDDEMAWFQNVAPVHPSSTLVALKSAVQLPENGVQRGHLLRLCLTLAYQEEHFPAAIHLVARWLPVRCQDGELERFKQLFQLLGSGTEARPPLRRQMMQELLRPPQGPAHWLGFEALGAMLRAGRFHGVQHQDFGARIFEPGWWPPEEEDQWYAPVLAWVSQQAKGPLRIGLQETLLSALPQLCTEIDDPVIGNALETCIRELILGDRVTGEAWAIVRAAMRIAGSASSQPDVFNAQKAASCSVRLAQLESLLRPTEWIDEVRTYAMVERSRLDEVMEESPQTTDEQIIAPENLLDARVRELGRALAARPDDIEVLLPELVTNPTPARVEDLGRGLGEESRSAPRCRQLWDQMANALAAASTDHRNVFLLRGFLTGIAEHDMHLAQQLLEEVVTHPGLGIFLPTLETGLSIDSAGAQRLIRAATAGSVPIRGFSMLKCGKATASIPAADFATLLQAIAGQAPAGLAVAMGVLHMRLHHEDRQSGGPALEVLQCGLELLTHPNIVDLHTHAHSGDRHAVAQVIRNCLKDRSQTHWAPQAHARQLAQHVKPSLARHGRQLGAILLPAL